MGLISKDKFKTQCNLATMSSNQIKVKQSKPNYQNLVLVGQYWSQVQNQCELKSDQRINQRVQKNQKHQFQRIKKNKGLKWITGTGTGTGTGQNKDRKQGQLLLKPTEVALGLQVGVEFANKSGVSSSWLNHWSDKSDLHKYSGTQI